MRVFDQPQRRRAAPHPNPPQRGEGARLLTCKPGPLRGLAACAIGKVAPDQAIGRIWPHLGALFLALIVIAVFPWISIGFL